MRSVRGCEIIRRLAKAIYGVIDGDPRIPTVREISELLKEQPRDQVEVLLSFLSRAFVAPSWLKKDDDRIASVKLTLALLPQTEQTVESSLRRFRAKADYELHFTLFCFLDEVPGVQGGSSFSTRIPVLVEEYLMQVPKSTALAAWMAGDLLGDHWDLRQGCNVLRRVVREARYVAGRGAAAHGLGKAAARSKGHHRRDIISLLRDVGKRDLSSSVRASATVALLLLR